MKKSVLLVGLLFMLSLLTGCVSSGSPSNTATQEKMPEKITIQVPTGPPTAPLLKMAEGKPLGEKVQIELIPYKTVEEATARVVKGEADYTILPINTAAKLYNKGIDISLDNVSTWGILYLLSTDQGISQWQDLKGKEVYVGAQGASPDIIARYLMEKNNIKTTDVTLKYGNSPEIAQMMIQGMVKTAVLPEPMVTQVLNKNQSAKVILDFHKEWQLAENNSNLPQTGMVVQNKFVKEYPAAISKIRTAYQEALEQTVADPASVSALMEENFNIPGPIFVKSMERTNLKFVIAEDAKTDVENYLAKLLSFSPDMVGGELPDEKFYLAK
ncbi:ABC transporter substrate-binding protein [Desulfotomaculum sp. 1211_IL3151]|uniref:ABC transporter substrate-binding protein n=1 Tax=Desulfotomaculum sp. 1211_IL3151 TaxID=3084055 RepID=UPI002FDB2D7D